MNALLTTTSNTSSSASSSAATDLRCAPNLPSAFQPTTPIPYFSLPVNTYFSGAERNHNHHNNMIPQPFVPTASRVLPPLSSVISPCFHRPKNLTSEGSSSSPPSSPPPSLNAFMLSTHLQPDSSSPSPSSRSASGSSSGSEQLLSYDFISRLLQQAREQGYREGFAQGQRAASSGQLSPNRPSSPAAEALAEISSRSSSSPSSPTTSRKRSLTPSTSSSDLAHKGSPQQRQINQRNRKLRKSTQTEELLILETSFRQQQVPTQKEKQKLAKRIGWSYSRVQVWFQNRRAKERRREGGSLSPVLLSSYQGHDLSEDGQYSHHRGASPLSAAPRAILPRSSDDPDRT